MEACEKDSLRNLCIHVYWTPEEIMIKEIKLSIITEDHITITSEYCALSDENTIFMFGEKLYMSKGFQTITPTNFKELAWAKRSSFQSLGIVTESDNSNIVVKKEFILYHPTWEREELLQLDAYINPLIIAWKIKEHFSGA